jgi:hypothetical protein
MQPIDNDRLVEREKQKTMRSNPNFSCVETRKELHLPDVRHFNHGERHLFDRWRQWATVRAFKMLSMLNGVEEAATKARPRLNRHSM